MQLGLLALAAIFLSSMGHGDNLKVSKGRRQRRISTEVPPSCSNGCEHCSEYNGCLRCKPRLFILLERNDIRQIGVCLAACPVGYFGIRNRDMNKCTQCKIENCEACFSRTFCTKCKEGLYSHRGRCYVSCPVGFSTVNGTMECGVPCEWGPWGPWGPCMKRNKTCGFKKGSQTRMRQPVPQPQSPDTSPGPGPPATCSPESETQRCAVRKRVSCRADRERKPKDDKQEEHKNRDKQSGRTRGRESKGGGGKRRKAQTRTTSAPAPTTSPLT